MKFRLQVADPQTAEESSWDIECSTVKEARERAKSAGYLVASIQPVAEPDSGSLRPPAMTTNMPCEPSAATPRSRIFVAVALLSLLALVIAVGVMFNGKDRRNSKSNDDLDVKPTPEFLAKVDEHTQTLTDLELRTTTFMRKVAQTFRVELPEIQRDLDEHRGHDRDLNAALIGQSAALLDLDARKLRKEVKREQEQLEVMKQPKGNTAIAKLLGMANGLITELDHLSDELSSRATRPAVVDP